MLSKSLTEISAVIGAHDYALQRNTLISMICDKVGFKDGNQCKENAI